MPQGVIIITHGSRRKEANDEIRTMVEMMQERDPDSIYQTAFLQFEQPDLKGAVDWLLAAGVQKVIVMPYFLVTGNHLSIDIMGLIQNEQQKHPAVEFLITKHLGGHPGMVDVVLDRIREARQDNKGLS